MSKILITGMTSSQCSSQAIAKNMSYSGLLKKAFEHAGYEVDLLPPNTQWTKEYLEGYEKVLVGLAPVTSLGAHYAYGAMHVMHLLLGDFRMVFYIDGPEPVKITSALNAWYKDTDNITKPFYSGRRDYSYAIDQKNTSNIAKVVGHLINDMWHMTLYPSLPWDYTHIKPLGQLPSGANNAIRGSNVDVFGINDEVYPTHKTSHNDSIAVDDLGTKWVQNVKQTTNSDLVLMREHKGLTDAQVRTRISQAKAAIITPYPSSGTWWSYRYLQAISTLTPVVTEWRESAASGMAGWNLLVSSIDNTSIEDLNLIGGVQYGSYLANIESKDNAAASLERTLLLLKEEENDSVQ
jgi:hypothetical protein